jgi:hypothetical protein
MNEAATWRKLHVRYGTANARKLSMMIAAERSWVPANARLIRGNAPFTRPNYYNRLNVAANTGTRNRAFRNAVFAAVTKAGVQVGKESAYGKVFSIGNGLVKKVMRFGQSHHNDLKIFMNEIRVGRTPGIQAVGPKIYAWRVVRDESGRMTKGEYIMDDFTAVPMGYKVFTLYDYIRKLRVCPGGDHPIADKVKAAMLTFWRITKGYHGDLHMNNIAVVVNMRTKLPKNVIIFDYGTHKRFKESTNAATCAEHFMKIIDREFLARSRKQTVQVVSKFNASAGKRVPMIPRTIAGRYGQPRRSNANLLRNMPISAFSSTRSASAASSANKRKSA